MSDPRFEIILSTLAQIGSGDFGVHLPEVKAFDELDAIMLGLRMVCEELQTSLEQRAHALKESELQSRFLAVMSHEIRTPLNGIIGSLDILEHSELDGEQRGMTMTMRTCSHQLLSIVNELLDFSKLTSGEVELNEEVVDLAEFIAQTIAPFRMSPKASSVECVVKTSLPAGLHVKCDGYRLRQILLNLLSNAYRFTESGRVILEVESTGREDSRERLRFAVTDTGAGIPKADQEKIFGSFYQAEQSATQREGSTGLGLPISQELVRRMGGTIAVHSTIGKGSRFSFEVAFERGTIVEPSTPKARPADIDLEWLKLLVVEDNSTNRTLLKLALKRYGIVPTFAHNGEEAVREVSAMRFDLVLMDCMMPVMDGFEATQRIRAAPLSSQPKIWALSAAATTGERERCLAVGMDGHLSKPIDADSLFQLLFDIASESKNSR